MFIKTRQLLISTMGVFKMEDWKHYVTWIGLFILIVGSFSWMAGVVNIDENALASRLSSKIKCDVPATEVDLTGVEERLDDIEVNLDEDDNWKDAAILLATEEWEEKDYKEIFKAVEDLYGDIDERDDIEYVKIKDEEVTAFDVDDKDAVVVQDVKVKYEDLTGQDQKVYLTIETEIEDNEVEDVEISIS